MGIIKRICVFLTMFWSVGFLLTLAVQAFAPSVLDIGFRGIGTGEAVRLRSGEQINVYIASHTLKPDIALLEPKVDIRSAEDEGALSVKPFSFPFSVAKPEPTFAHALYTVKAGDAREISITWLNPRDGYFLAVSRPLLSSAVAFGSLIFFSALGAALLYLKFGKRVLKRLEITPPPAD